MLSRDAWETLRGQRTYSADVAEHMGDTRRILAPYFAEDVLSASCLWGFLCFAHPPVRVYCWLVC